MRGLCKAAICLSALLTVLSVAVPANAGDITQTATADRDSVVVGRVEVARPALLTTGKESDPVYRDCTVMPLELSPFIDNTDSFSAIFNPVSPTETMAWQYCVRIADNQEVAWIIDTAVGEIEVDPLTMMIEMARATINIPLPAIATSPPVGGTQLVGLPVWFWSNTHYARSVTASIPGLSATLTATPGDLVIDMGDGTTLTCPSGGIRYDPALSHRDQSTDCSGPYDRHGQFTTTATVVWALTWTASNGQSGTLPPVVRRSTTVLNIQQAQAVTD